MPRITMKDIAKKAGVARQTVSAILSDENYKVSKETRQRVLRLVKEMKYKPNTFAQSLKTGKTNMIGITTSNGRLAHFNQTYPSHIYKGIGDFFTDRQYRLIFDNFNETLNPGKYLKIAESKQVDGFIFLLFSDKAELFNQQEASRLKEFNIPFVAIHSLREHLNFPSVGVDCVKAGYLATRHLIEHHYGSIGCVNMPEVKGHCNDLFLGYQQAMEENGLAVRDEYLYNTIGLYAGQGYKIADSILQSKTPLPRSLFVVDEDLSYGMIKRFTETGLRVPDDIALVSFGDLDTGAIHLTGLTTVSQPAEEKGFKAGELLWDILENPGKQKENRTVILEPELTVRKSCGC